jgi:mevalonate kinase
VGATGKACGKLILFGEDAAVYGHPAVGVTLPESTTVNLGDSDLPEWDVGTIPREDRDGVVALLARLEEILPEFLSAGRRSVQVQSGVARMAGFGSSAAPCGAFARAAIAHVGENGGDVARAWSLAHQAERLFHGTPSGVDTGFALLGGVCVLRPKPPGLPEYRRIPGCAVSLVVGALARDEACAALVAGLAARVNSGDRAARASIEALGGIASDAAQRMSEGGAGVAEALGAFASRAMDHLRAVGLGNPAQNSLLESAAAAGALGGKLSGAGGGGAF